MNRICLTLILTLAAFGRPAAAALKTFYCDGINNNWSAATNWIPVGIPANGDNLVFGNSPRRDCVNDLVALKANSISLSSGYLITGNGLVLSNGLSCSGSLNTLGLNLTLGGSQTFSCNVLNAGLKLSGTVTLVGFDLTLDVAASVEIPGTMTGTGNVIKSGPARSCLVDRTVSMGRSRIRPASWIRRTVAACPRMLSAMP